MRIAVLLRYLAWLTVLAPVYGSASSFVISGTVKYRLTEKAIPDAYVVVYAIDGEKRNALPRNIPLAVGKSDKEGRFRLQAETKHSLVRVSLISDYCEWGFASEIIGTPAGSAIIDLLVPPFQDAGCDEVTL